MLDVTETLSRLNALKDNPEEFEKLARQLLHEQFELIADGDAEKLRRLHAMQWAWDQRKRKFKDPKARLELFVVPAFLEQIERFRHALDSLVSLDDE